VIGRHANPVHPEKSVEELEILVTRLRRLQSRRPAPSPTVPHSPLQRLTVAQLTNLVDAYNSGTSTNALAAAYGMSKGSVLKLLAQQHVDMRRQPPTLEQVEKAAALYSQGNSIATVATKLGLSQTAVRNHLRKHGVAFRPRGGSGRAQPNA